MHLFVNLSFALTKQRWSPTIQTCLDKKYLPWEVLSQWIGLKEKCCAGILVFVVPYGAPLHVLVISVCTSLMWDICCLLHRETAVTFVPGLLLERNVIFRAGEESNITVVINSRWTAVWVWAGDTDSPGSCCWAALWLKLGLWAGTSRVGAEEPGRGLGDPQVSLVSASVGNSAI